MKKHKAKKKSDKKLKLGGEKPDYSRFKIKKNQQVPTTRGLSSYWDHLIAKLDKGDAIEMSKKESHSLTNRARGLGYVVVLRKQGEDKYIVWFGGLKK